ncbi:MAG: GNAT family N-acetyltransferase [Terriglobales bacterium]
MGVHKIDPLTDDRWPDLLERHSRASAFHSRSWLNELKRTYGYEPVVYTTTAPGMPLTNGWVFCRIQSWLTGLRLVSLPFSDHCDPLTNTDDELQQISQAVLQDKERQQWRYIECRLPKSGAPGFFGRTNQFHLHKLDLEPDLSALYEGLHQSSTQRKIKRAEREQLTCEMGSSEKLLSKFYQLLVRTRFRHKVPPQPRKWFSNLLNGFGNQLTVWIASKQQTPVASILTIRFKSSLVYKYGGTDERFFRFGGMQLLLWQAIMDAKKNGLKELDLGRSDLDDRGLSAFKDRLGATSSCLTYFRYPAESSASSVKSEMSRYRKLASYVPGGLLSFGGRLLYRHFG